MIISIGLIILVVCFLSYRIIITKEKKLKREEKFEKEGIVYERYYEHDILIEEKRFSLEDELLYSYEIDEFDEDYPFLMAYRSEGKFRVNDDDLSNDWDDYHYNYGEDWFTGIAYTLNSEGNVMIEEEYKKGQALGIYREFDCEGRLSMIFYRKDSSRAVGHAKEFEEGKLIRHSFFGATREDWCIEWDLQGRKVFERENHYFSPFITGSFSKHSYYKEGILNRIILREHNIDVEEICFDREGNIISRKQVTPENSLPYLQEYRKKRKVNQVFVV